MSAKTARKPSTPTTPAVTPTMISLSDVAEIRWRGHGKEERIVTLTAERLAGVLRIAEMLWHDEIAWTYLGDQGVALSGGNLKGLLADLIYTGEPADVSTLAIMEGVAASMEAHAMYGDGGKPEDFTLVMRDKAGAA